MGGFSTSVAEYGDGSFAHSVVAALSLSSGKMMFALSSDWSS